MNKETENHTPNNNNNTYVHKFYKQNKNHLSASLKTIHSGSLETVSNQGASNSRRFSRIFVAGNLHRVPSDGPAKKEAREKNGRTYEKARRGRAKVDLGKRERGEIRAVGSSNEVRSHVKGLRIIWVAPVSAACRPIRRFSDTIYNHAG